MPSHSLRPLSEPSGWNLYVSHYEGRVKRLVVFVHGFRGESVGTWSNFPLLHSHDPDRIWWYESDMLFVGYDSTKDTITGIANRFRREIDRFYPRPQTSLLSARGRRPRADISAYSELVLVGHSLGAVILRRVLCDTAQLWSANGRRDDERPPLLNAVTRLFSPASAGFQPSGLLGLLRATGGWDRTLEVILRRSPAYSDLQPDSVVLREIRFRTIGLKPDEDGRLAALRAHILWANPDGVVITERYVTDHVDYSWDGRNHSAICKPQLGAYEAPWGFVANGKI